MQPCRRRYLLKDLEEGYELELENNHVLSPKDLCALPFIEKLIESEIHAFKIEGRSRSPEYVKTVTSCYRKAIDDYFENKLTKELKNKLIHDLEKVYNRGFSSGFYLGKPINEFIESNNQSKTKKTFIGIIKNYYRKNGVAEIKLFTRKLKLNDTIMIQGPTTGVIDQKVNSMEIEHKKISEAEKGMEIGIKLDKIVRKNDKVFLME